MQRVGRSGPAQPRPAGAQQIVHRALGRHARVARGADAQMLFDRAPVGVGQLAVDKRRDERVERLTVMH
jgi:hypothetical protein